MSIIHWNKSVLTFHLKEIAEDGEANHPLTLLGLSAIALGPLVLPAAAKLGRPLAKAAIKSYLSLSEQPKISGTPAPVRDRQCLCESSNVPSHRE
ncbi:MAG: hypothetical protein SVX43_03020 [Cyanobacteriota bacterium]|nr:hypothetical protein [Cyanobacteriota bacterium]